MKKIYLSLIAIAFAINFSYAQWTTIGGNIYNSNTGNVGIGTTNPHTPLEVHNGADQNITMRSFSGINQIELVNDAYNVDVPLRFDASQYQIIGGNVGVGTTSPDQTLSLQNSSAPAIDFYTGVNNRAIISATSALLTLNSLTSNPISFQINSSELMHISANGNVGIGTTTPDQLLTVNGTIHSKEVLVNLTGFPDYVFKPTYHLPTLTEVKTYIEQNHHLPGMPTETEVVKNGLKIGETEALLTKKLEEVTLYLIQQKEEINKLKHQISTLKLHKK